MENVKTINLLNSLLTLVIFSIIGTSLRMGLVYISNFKGSPITAEALPQILGCFLFGLMSEFKDLDLINLGIQTGLAGSLTTFSGWMFDIWSDFVNFKSVDRTVSHSIYAGLLNIITILLVCFSSYYFGINCASESHRKYLKVLDDYLRNSKILFALSCGLWTTSLFLGIFIFPVCYALVLAPFGKYLGFYIGSRLNQTFDQFPLGTFVSNMIGTVILAGMTIASYYSSGSGCFVISAITAGFCGCLTTLSSFIDEIACLEKINALRYCFLSMILGLLIIFFMNGTFILVKNVKENNLNC